jgi:hypothetical protein
MTDPTESIRHDPGELAAALEAVGMTLEDYLAA